MGTVVKCNRVVDVTGDGNFRRFLKIFTLERGMVVGLTIGLAGFLVAVYSVEVWVAARLAALDPQAMMRIAIPSVTLMIAGAEIIFASFVLSFIDVQPDRRAA